jgi:hypothetical protein
LFYFEIDLNIEDFHLFVEQDPDNIVVKIFLLFVTVAFESVLVLEEVKVKQLHAEVEQEIYDRL